MNEPECCWGGGRVSGKVRKVRKQSKKEKRNRLWRNEARWPRVEAETLPCWRQTRAGGA